ncbi:MAG: LmeA family phospholipid-binding protein [Candidatus Firestonebacteria bacterium]|nr:LmeA family phospholipid-binding protein [Candidatus Firestonebacteria bacterium]
MTSDTIVSRKWLWVLLLVLTLAGLNLYWLAVDRQPFAWDESIHYMDAVGYYQVLLHPAGDWVKRILFLSDFYPPLNGVLTALLFLLTGPSTQTAAFFNVFYLLAVIVLMWRLGARWQQADVGVTAAYVVMAGTMVVLQSKYFMLDIPLMFWVMAGFFVYLASREFMIGTWSLLYGLILGAALLNKWSAVFFLGLPPLAALLRLGWKRAENPQAIWLNVAWLYAVAALAAVPWYGVHLVKLIHSSSGLLFARGVLEGDPALTSPASWTYYLLAVVRQMSWPLGLLLLLGAGLALWLKRHIWLWSVWLGLPYVILTFIRNKDDRYTLPLLPLLALLALSWLDVLSAPVRRWLQVAIMLFALVQMGYAHVGAGIGRLHHLGSQRILGQALMDSQAPQAQVWPQARILKNVEDLGADFTPRPVLRVVPDEAHFSRVSFAVEQSRHPRSSVILSGNTDWPAFTDFIVTKTGSLGLPFAVERPQAVTRELLASQTDPRRRFELVRQYPLPDGSEARLFMRRDLSDAGSAAKILDELHRDLARLLAQYVQDSRKLTLEIIPGTPEQTLQGHFQNIFINIQDARVGDFKHKPWGVPVKSLQLELADLVLDLEHSRQGQLIPYALGRLSVRRLELEETAVNQALQNADGDLKKAVLHFLDQRLQADWLGKPKAGVELGLSVARRDAQPDNLRFTLKRLRLHGQWWPAGWLQPLVEDFNPLLKYQGFPARVELGKLRLEKGRLLLGTDLEK